MQLQEKSFELTWPPAVESAALQRPGYSWWLLTDCAGDDSLQLQPVTDSAPVQSSVMMVLLLVVKDHMMPCCVLYEDT